MKKGFLFGLGVLIAGGVLAATISTVSIDTKTPGDTVTNQEFNSITSGLGEVTDTLNGTTSDATSITIPKDISATKVSTPELCLDGDCQSTWPEGGEGGAPDNLGNHIATQSIIPSKTALDLGSSSNIFATVYSKSLCLNGDCRGEWPTGGTGSGVSNQACGTGQVVKGITDGTFDCVVDANDGSGDSPIGTLQAAKWCWSPDGTTIDCDQLAPDAGSATCVDYQYHKCISNKLWWFDSCGMNMALLKEDCASLGGCTTGEIGGTCANSSGGGTDNLGNHIATQNIEPNNSGTLNLGSSAKKFQKITVNQVNTSNLCLGTDCKTAWPTGGGAGDDLGDHTATQNIKKKPSTTVDIGARTEPFDSLYATKVYSDEYCYYDSLNVRRCTSPQALEQSKPTSVFLAQSPCNVSTAGRTRITTSTPSQGSVTRYQVCMKLIENGGNCGSSATYQWVTLFSSTDIAPEPGTSIIEMTATEGCTSPK